MTKPLAELLAPYTVKTVPAAPVEKRLQAERRAEQDRRSRQDRRAA